MAPDPITPMTQTFTVGQFSGYVEDDGEGSFTVRLEQGTGYIEADLTQVSAGDIGQGVATVQVRSGHMGPA